MAVHSRKECKTIKKESLNVRGKGTYLIEDPTYKRLKKTHVNQALQT